MRTVLFYMIQKPLLIYIKTGDLLIYIKLKKISFMDFFKKVLGNFSINENINDSKLKIKTYN
jgi:hypothetical protein